ANFMHDVEHRQHKSPLPVQQVNFFVEHDPSGRARGQAFPKNRYPPHSASKDIRAETPVFAGLCRERAFVQARGRLFRDHALVASTIASSTCRAWAAPSAAPFSKSCSV